MLHEVRNSAAFDMVKNWNFQLNAKQSTASKNQILKSSFHSAYQHLDRQIANNSGKLRQQSFEGHLD